MRYFFDTEFIEDGKTIDLISIGVVAEDGREFYRCSNEARLELASDWVRANVFPHLAPTQASDWVSRHELRDQLAQFIGDDPKIEFWAYYADYDWVALCQLFGTMMDLPRQFPKFCMDLKQLSVMCGSPKHPEQDGDEHHALADARWNMRLYNFLTKGAEK